MSALLKNWRVAALAVTLALLAAVAVRTAWRAEPDRSRSQRAGLFARFDRNGDGIARREEVPAELRQQFEFLLARAGQSKLGALTRVQFERALRAGKAKGAGKPAGPNVSPGATPAAEQAAQGKRPSNKAAKPIVQQSSGSGAEPSTEPAAIAKSETKPPASGTTAGGPEAGQAGAGPQPAAAQPGETSPSVPPATAGQQANAAPAPKASPGPALRPPAVATIQPTYSQAKLFDLLDTNRDGSLDAAEIPAAYRLQLMAADANGDGRLSLSEFAAGIRAAARSEQGGGGKAAAVPSGSVPARPAGGLVARPAPGEPVPTRPKPKRAPPAEGLPDWFSKYDANGDNQVAQYEWIRHAALDAFQRFDRNKDGFITAQEAAAANGAAPAANTKGQ